MFPKEHGKEPYPFLIYLLFPVIGAFFMEGINRMITIFFIVSFVAIFRQSYWRNSYFTYICMQAIIIGYWAYLLSPMFLWFSAFSTNLLVSVSAKKRLTGIGIYVAIVIAISLMKSYEPIQIMLSSLPIIINGFNVYTIVATRKWRESQQRLEKANDTIDELIKQQERQRIGRDLHDTLGQKLSMITLKTELAEKLLHPDPSKASVELKEVISISRATLKQMRELVEDLETESLEDELTAGRQHLESAGIQTNVYAHSIQMNRAYEKIAVMATRELVTNVVKHSHATCCSIHVERTTEGVTIRVEDDGIGFKDAVPNYGMLGLQGRIDLINGTIDWNSNRTGTIVQIHVPIPQGV